MASRVVPGASCTTARSSPTRRLKSVDLPTFGRPTIATEKASRLGCDALVIRQLGHHGIEEVSGPSTVARGDRVRCTETEPRELPRVDLTARVVDLVHCDEDGLPGAAEHACDGFVLLEHPDRRVDDAHNDVRGGDRPLGLLAHLPDEHLGIVGRGARGQPSAGVDDDEVAPAQLAPSSLRSRVTPGCSSTIAVRLPTMRFTSVDLPTFGRPTTATTGVRVICMGRSLASRDPAR